MSTNEKPHQLNSVWVATYTLNDPDGDCDRFLGVYQTYEGALKFAKKAMQSHNIDHRKIVVDRVADYDPRHAVTPARVYIIGEGAYQWIDVVPVRVRA